MREHGWCNRAHASAWRKGYEAAEGGQPASANPYQDKRTDSGKVTFSRAFRKAWAEGWAAGMGGCADRGSAIDLWRAAKAYHVATQDPERTESSQADAFEVLIEAVHLADYVDVVDGCCPCCGRR